MSIEKYDNTLPDEVNERYLDHWSDAGCGDTSLRPRFEEHGGHVTLRGFPSFPAWCESVSDTITHALDRRASASRYPKIPFLIRLNKPVDILGHLPLRVLYDEDVNEVLKNHFGCHYRIAWLDCYRTVPGDNLSSSWLWHADNLPVPVAKIVIPFTDFEKTGGTTEILPPRESDALKASGYTGYKDRVEDLTPYAESRGLDFHPQKVNARPGTILIFHPNTLHKAVLPHTGHRDVMSLLLVASIMPWDEDLERRGGLGVVQDNPGGYPEDPYS